MGTFTGGIADEIITPFEVSATVIVTDAARPSAANDTIFGGAGFDTIDGGGGDDLIDGGFAADLIFGGDGADTILWNPGGGSDTVDGGRGADLLQFNGSNIGEVITLSAAAGGHAALTRDVASIAMDLDNVERVAFRALGGADRFVLGDLSTTDIGSVDIDLAGFAGPDSAIDRVETAGRMGDDHLVLTTAGEVSTVAGLSTAITLSHAEGNDVFAFAGGEGADTVDVSRFAGGISLEFDGGAGNDALLIRGDAKAASTIALFGPETGMAFEINGAVSNAVLTGVESIAVTGGDAGDVINAGVLNPTTAQLTIDGGKGDDTITGSNAADTVNGGAGDDLIRGNRGNDLLLGEGGDDTFVWGPGDGSDSIDGGGGTDTLSFNMSNIAEVIEVADIGGAVLTRNIAGITMSLDNVEHIALGGGAGGADVIFIGDLSATEIRAIDIDLGFAGVGDGAADAVSASGTSKSDTVVVTGSGGAAAVTGTSANVTIAHADAGDRLTVSTFDGADKIDVRGFTGGIDLGLWGGGGSDRFSFGPSTGANVIIRDFQAHSLAGSDGDVISVTGSSDRTLVDALFRGHIVQSGADVVVSDDHGVIVTLQNVQLSDLGAKDFLFG